LCKDKLDDAKGYDEPHEAEQRNMGLDVECASIPKKKETDSADSKMVIESYEYSMPL